MINDVLNQKTAVTDEDAAFIWGDQGRELSDWIKMEFCSPAQLRAFKALMVEGGMNIDSLQTIDSRKNGYFYNDTHQLVYVRENELSVEDWERSGSAPRIISLNGTVVSASGEAVNIYINVGVMINRKRIFEKSNMLYGTVDDNFGDNLGFWRGPNDSYSSLVWTKEGNNK